MLFDLYPKTKLKDLFGREREFREFREALELGERLIVIYGMRRTGKTSLLKTCLYELEYPFVYINVGEIFREHCFISKFYLYEEMACSFTENMGFFEKIGFKLRELLRRTRAFHISGSGVEVEPAIERISISSLLRAFNSWARKHSTRFIVAFDEAQYLRFSGKTRYDGIFAWAIDELENITIVLTGSEVGVLRDFLKFEDPKAPLFGRYRREIFLKKFDKKKSLEFLKEGFKQLNMNVSPKELEEAVETFDGVVGWLTHYGYYRAVRKLNHKEAISKVFREGSKLVLDELEKIIEPSRERYVAILKAVSKGVRKWSEIKTYVEFKTKTKIYDRNFSNLLEKLVKYGVLEKQNNTYKITDPLIDYVVKEYL